MSKYRVTPIQEKNNGFMVFSCGGMSMGTVHFEKKRAIRDFIEEHNNFTWKQWYRKGYRVYRVRETIDVVPQKPNESTHAGA